MTRSTTTDDAEEPYVIHKARTYRGSNALPARAHILHVDEQDGELTVWYAVPKADSIVSATTRTLHVYGTGYAILPSMFRTHVGTVCMSSGLVWHVFDPDGPAPL